MESKILSSCCRLITRDHQVQPRTHCVSGQLKLIPSSHFYYNPTAVLLFSPPATLHTHIHTHHQVSSFHANQVLPSLPSCVLMRNTCAGGGERVLCVVLTAQCKCVTAVVVCAVEIFGLTALACCSSTAVETFCWTLDSSRLCVCSFVFDPCVDGNQQCITQFVLQEG